MTEKKEQQESKVNNVVEQLCKTITQEELSTEEILEVVPKFLFSIGASLENCDLQKSEEVLCRYAESPTFGNALMAQALWMKETWAMKPKEERQTNDE